MKAPDPAAIKAAALAWQQARALHAAGRLQEAEPQYRKALAVMAQAPDLLADYGRLAAQLGDWRASEQIWRKVAALAPQRATDNHLGLALVQQGRLDEGLAALQAHQQRFADDVDSMVNLAACLAYLGRQAEAEPWLRRAVQLRPAFQHAWESLANLLINLGDRAAAGEVLAQATALHPQNAELRYMLMEHRLKCRDYGGGFDLFEARWGTRLAGTGVRLPTDRRWDGTPFTGRLLVRAEQGIGDELLYSSLFTDLLARHADTLIDCDPRLLPLFSRSFPAATFIARTTPEDDPRRSGYARQCIAGDLCRWLRRSEADFLTRAGWLQPDPQRRDALRAQYRERHGNALRVGLSWRSKRPVDGDAKSLALEQLLPLLQLPGVVFFNLQYGDVAADIAALRAAHGIEVQVEPTVDPTDDLDGLAAQVAALDLVVSTSNSTVHLAGAVGVPTLVLLHRDRGLPWYWAYEGEQVPWYPGTRLLRCPQRGDWAPVIAAARDAVAARATGR